MTRTTVSQQLEASEAERATVHQENAYTTPGLRTLKALLFCALLCSAAIQPTSADAADTTGEAALAGCIQGAVTVSLLSWGIAVLTSPFTLGASLAAAPAIDAVIWGSAAGCAAGALGSSVAHAATHDG